MCERRQFRRDLYFCLRALRVRLQPLHERLGDLPALVEALARTEGCAPDLHRDPEFMDWLLCRQWSGNLRELRNVLQRVRVLGQLAVMNEPDELPAANAVRRAGPNQTPTPLQPVAERIEQAYIVRLLRQHHGNVIQSAHAAQRSCSWLRNRINRYGIELDEFRGMAGMVGAGEEHKAAG
jgi:DNA-binding NtrC family response regulator